MRDGAASEVVDTLVGPDIGGKTGLVAEHVAQNAAELADGLRENGGHVVQVQEVQVEAGVDTDEVSQTVVEKGHYSRPWTALEQVGLKMAYWSEEGESELQEVSKQLAQEAVMSS